MDSTTTCDTWTGDGKEFAFRIQTAKDELILCATSEVDCKEWIDAVRMAANPPPPPSTGNAELDRANAAAHAEIVEAQRKADEAERLAKEGAGVMKALSIVEGGLEGAAGSLLGGAAGEIERAALAKAAELLKIEEAKKAEEAKQAQYAKLKVPISCEKKLSSESSYHTRFVWVNSTTKEFHWAKTNDVSKSKSINCKANIKSVSQNSEVGAHNFTIELKDVESVFTGMFSTVPTSIDVKMEDGELNLAMISLLKELMV